MTRLYRFLLKLYPPSDRLAFGDEMLDVFLQAEADAAGCGAVSRAWFYFREWSDLLAGAARERLYALGETRGWKFLSERGPVMHRERRYPYTSIVFMSLALAIIVLTIAKAQGIAYYVVQMYTINGQLVIQTRQHLEMGNAITHWPSHWGLLASIGMFFAVTWLAAVVAWVVTHALRRSGVQRLDEVQTWPQAR